jgi:hypothetical protein
MTDPKFPDIDVAMVGEDGNAFAIIGRVRLALRRGGLAPEEVAEFTDEAMSGDYDHLLATVVRWVRVDRTEDEDDGA